MRERLTILFCLSLGFSAVACGGVSATTDAPSPDDDGGAAIGTDDAGSDPGTDGGKATPSDGGTSSALAIDPIAMGNAWTYDVTVAGSYSACTNGSSTSNVTQAATVGGKDGFLVSSFCASLGSFWYSVDGDRVYVYDGSKWTVALDAPVQDGHTWTGAGDTLVWKSAGSVTVPAGTFGDCFTAEDQAAPSYYAVTFCRGVGPVKWHYRDASSNGYDAVLTAKSF
ncbi:MAG TPA: hypothetical protein VF407_19880 [Polyangiaceae bacterium]